MREEKNIRPTGRIGRGFLLLATADCPAGYVTLARRIDIVLPGGGVVPSGVSLTRGCHGWEMSRMGLPERAQQPPRPRPGSAGTLRPVRGGAEVVRVRPAGPLHYRVTLENPSSREVRLRPCPTYTEALYAARPPIVRSYRLNCSRVHAIPAHGRVTYAMRVWILRRLTDHPDMFKLSWSLNTPNEPALVLILLVREPAG